jgi:RNA polymerase sigma-70 factor, ECF subfamily
VLPNARERRIDERSVRSPPGRPSAGSNAGDRPLQPRKELSHEPHTTHTSQFQRTEITTQTGDDVSLRGRLSLLAVFLRNVVQLRPHAFDPTLTSMAARALVQALGGERARFVHMARSRVGTEADAEDVVQRAMMRAAERAALLEDPARLRAWFYRILRRTIADHHRSKPRGARHEPLDGNEACDQGGLDAAAARSGCACAVRLLGELRPAYAEAVRRVDYDGQDPAAVAAALRVSTTNLYVRLHRARAALRERVERHCGVSSAAPCLDCMCSAHERCGGP